MPQLASAFPLLGLRLLRHLLPRALQQVSAVTSLQLRLLPCWELTVHAELSSTLRFALRPLPSR